MRVVKNTYATINLSDVEGEKLFSEIETLFQKVGLPDVQAAITEYPMTQELYKGLKESGLVVIQP